MKKVSFEMVLIGLSIAATGIGMFFGSINKKSYTIPTPHYLEVEEEKRQYKLEEASVNSNIMHEKAQNDVETVLVEEIPTETEKALKNENTQLYSDYDISLLERVVMSEASIESYQCKIAVCETILNRSELYGSSIEEIVTAPYQYSMADNGQPTEEVKQAVQQAINQRTYDTNMIYFREDYYFSFGTPYMNIDSMYFSCKG